MGADWRNGWGLLRQGRLLTRGAEKLSAATDGSSQLSPALPLFPSPQYHPQNTPNFSTSIWILTIIFLSVIWLPKPQGISLKEILRLLLFNFQSLLDVLIYSDSFLSKVPLCTNSLYSLHWPGSSLINSKILSDLYLLLSHAPLLCPPVSAWPWLGPTVSHPPAALTIIWRLPDQRPD